MKKYMKKVSLISIAILTVASVNAQNWTSMNSGSTSNLRGVHFPTTMIGYAVGNDGAILKSTDQGVTWSGTTNEYPGYWFWDVHFTNENVGYVVGETNPQTNPSGNGIILKTTDGGANWMSMFSGNPDPIRDLFVLDENTLFACGGAEMTTTYVLKSIDAGATWNATGASYSDAIMGGMYFLDANTGFMGLYESVFGTVNPTSMTWLETSDGSNFNTTVIPNSISYWNFATDFVTTTIGYSTRSTYSGIDSVYVKKTIDGGVTWLESAIQNYLGSIYSIDFIIANIGYGVGGTGLNSSIFRTDDGGNTWISEEAGTTEELHGTYFFDENVGISVGNNGTIIKREPDNVGTDDISSMLISTSVYPNPTSGSSVMEVEINESMRVKVLMVSIEGKQINERERFLSVGKNTIDLQTEVLKPGIYLMNIVDEEGNIKSRSRIIKH